MADTRERTRERRALADSRFRQILDNIQDAVILDDVDGNLLYASRRFCELFGVAEEDVKTLQLEDYVAPEWRAMCRRYHDQRVRGEDPPSVYEYEGLKKNGERMWLEVHVLKAVEKGKVIGTQSAIRDITARKRTEEALHRSTTTLDELVRTLPLAVNVLDGDARIQMWNPAAERMFGWTADELIGQPYPLAGGDRTEEHRRMLAASILEGKAWSGLETVRNRKDGSTVEVAIWSSPLRDASGAITASLAVLVDISERRRAEQDYRLLFESALDAILIFEPENETVLEVNPRACELYGYRREEFIGMSLIPMTKDVPRGRERLRQLAAGNPDPVYHTVHLRKDGKELHLETRASKVRYRGRDAVMSILRDHTERTQLQRERLHAQKLEAVGQLAGGVAHDFNNLLTSILGSAGILSSRLGPGHDLRPYVEEINAASERAGALTRHLLTFSRKQMIRPRPLDLNALLRGMNSWLRRLVEENIDLRVETCAVPSSILADRGQIEQVVLNLVLNARDAMPEGGRLTIRTESQGLTGDLARARTRLRLGSYVVLVVSDTGEGMDEETLLNIFTPFFTTKPVGKGTGLGLSSVHGIVRQGGGDILVESSPGRGSTFRVYLPVCGAAVEEAPVPVTSMLPGSGTILVVEDDPLVRKVTCRTLEVAGYNVLEADTVGKAERVFADKSGAIDLVLTDVVMPGKNGPDLVKELLRKRRVPVLFMSGYIKDEAGRDELSGAPFLPKPFTPSELTAAVRRVLDAGLTDSGA